MVTGMAVDYSHKGGDGQWSQGWRLTIVTKVEMDSGHRDGGGR